MVILISAALVVILTCEIPTFSSHWPPKSIIYIADLNINYLENLLIKVQGIKRGEFGMVLQLALSATSTTKDISKSLYDWDR